MTFAPWLDAIRTAGVLSDRDVLDAVGPACRAELARVFPELGPPPRLAGRDGHGRFFEAMARLVDHLAARRPAMIVLEDLHAAEPMSAGLLAFLARRLRDRALLIVVTARAEEIDPGSGLELALRELRSEETFAEIALAPLDHAQTAQLVMLLAGRDPRHQDTAALAERIWHVSAGNPFLAVETLQMLRPGATGHPPDAALVSGRIRDVVTARLDGLSAPARHLARVAAVVGRAFEFRLVQRASAFDDDTAATAVEELVRRRILQGAGHELDFTHDHIRAVAYGAISPVRRRLLHGAVAAALEATAATALEAHYGALARHFEEAGVWDKAVAYLRSAGEAAVQRGRNREAVARLQHALELLDRCPRDVEWLELAVDFRMALRPAWHALGEFDRAVAASTEASELAQRLGDPRRLAWIDVQLAGTLWVIDRASEGLACTRRALETGERLDDVKLQVAAGTLLGGLLSWVGDSQGATRLLRQTLTRLHGELAVDRLGLSGYPSVLSRTWLVVALSDLGDFDDGLLVGEEGLRLAETLDHPYSLMQACWGLGRLHVNKGNFTDAAALFARADRLALEWEMRSWSAYSRSLLAPVYVASGRIEEAVALLHQLLNDITGEQLKATLCQLHQHLADAYVAAGRPECALPFAEQALARARHHGERVSEAWALKSLGDIATARATPDMKSAAGWYQDAVTLAQDLGLRPLMAHCSLALGRLHDRWGRDDLARQHRAAAIESFRTMGMTAWLTRAEAELAGGTRAHPSSSS